MHVVNMSREAYHHGDLRAALVAAGIELLEERGPYALSLREVARQVGVSATATYRHFDDKDALLAAIAAEGFTELGERFGGAAEAMGEPSDRLAAVGMAYVGFARERPTMFRLMFGGAIPVEALKGGEARYGGAAFDALLAAVAAGGRSPDDPRLLPDAVRAWSLVHGYAMLLLDGRLPKAARDEAFLAAVLRPHDSPAS